MPKNKLANYSTFQLTALVILRMMIGWHLLYEGISKLINPYWSSASYLMESKWIFSGWFQSIVANPTALKVVDFLNEWGLVAIGLGLIAGILTQVATIAGLVLLLLYYLATPPLVGLSYSIPSEGSYLIINKTLIEAAALLVLAVFPTGKKIGFDALFFKK
ncbi:MAG: DoxX family membrane protein [candidate division KSB1 bacterium]|nr:DoxX family membrane protein [candidate division KSB1 bacterium]MDZ7357633.1 DoxX family membrane protein [candidate division KSB1 bacterium]MDZ7401554.1 DoxX family membrane protein [candidate division KSB1 bacterium]